MVLFRITFWLIYTSSKLLGKEATQMFQYYPHQ